jgi:cyclic pyranopterin phosphate synthase
MNPYSTSKAAWHPDRIEAMRRGEQAAPVELQLIISDLCNHDCHWCAYRASDGLSSEGFGGLDLKGNQTHNPHRMIATPKVMEILDDAYVMGVKSVIFTGGGEPTVHPDHIGLFKYALDLGLEASLNTNGNLLRTGWERVLPRLTYIRFSVDAANATEHSQTRRIGLSAYSTVLYNLTHLCAEVKRQGSPCVIGAGYVVTPEGYVNIRDGIKNIRDTGASYVRLASLQSTKGMSIYPEIERVRATLADAKAELETPDFQVVNLFDAAFGKRMPDPFCGFEEIVTYVGANLKVYRCCYVAYTPLGECGDLANMRFRDWFESEEKRKSFEKFDARSCTVCPLYLKNEEITRIVRAPSYEAPTGTPPVHVNFP